MNANYLFEPPHVGSYKPADDNKFMWNSGAVHVDLVCFRGWHHASLEINRK
jgi:hypothetical protein